MLKPNRRIDILTVDDRPEGLLALEALLKDSYQVTKATSGKQALAFLEKADFAMVLLDAQMPEMSGFETAKIIKSDERTKHIPILFITAINMEMEHVRLGYDSGAIDYIFKPYHPDILRSKVSQFASIYKMRKEIESQAQVLFEKNSELSQLNESLKDAQKEIVEISERERRRLGLDLHDGLAQELSAASYMLHSLKGRIKQALAPKDEKVLQDTVNVLQGALENCRHMSRSFYPVELERSGLTMAFGELALNKSRIYKIDCRFFSEGEVPESIEENPTVKTQLYRIAQEAIQNAIRHSEAKNLTVRMINKEGQLIVEVQDDGKGLGDHGKSNGMGLRIMNHRAQMIGAELLVESLSQQGTCVRCVYPYQLAVCLSGRQAVSESR